ncbi:MAG: hypothetical protein M3321_03100 [Actinomycetota bacterium]|nr:hypothetical protein [Actinomycetota bacterium]
MSDVLDEGQASKPCGCDEAALSAQGGEDVSLDELDSALASLEGGAEGDLLAGGDLELAGLEAELDDLMMGPPAGEGAVTLEELLGLLEHYPGLKLTISF